jgi:DNA-binding beta-propeller fold protein YncE
VTLPEPAGMVAVTPDGSRVMITYFNFEYWTGGTPQESFFQVMDADTEELGERIPAGRFPLNIVTDRDGTTAYVTSYFTGSLYVIDLESGAVQQSHAGKGPHGLVVIEPAAAAA